MWFKIKSFFSFLLKSTNQHSVHSPFVFDLVTKCFYTKTNPSKIKKFQEVKKWLKNYNKSIEVEDFGSGSKVFKSNNRKVSKIAKIAGISSKKAYLLIRITEYFNLKNILEIGTSVGLSTSALSIGSANSTILTLEGCENTSKIALEVFNKFNFNNITIETGNFKDTLAKVTENNQFDLVYFDGNHQKDATLNNFEQCLKTVNNNSIFIFDDIYWSNEMQEAWETIKLHPKVTVSINTFFWGIVFFRKEQAKEHFTIRI